jgi:ubiquinone/menaquinone biosynthesis C-methylase UbiE
MKNFVNKLLRKATGYQISRFDASRYIFRDKLKEFMSEQSLQGEILDIGSARWNYPKEHFYKANVTTLDVEPPADVVGDVMNLPFKEATFDFVICLETLEHVRNPFKAMNEIYRVLRPGGKFIGSAPFMYEIHGEEYGDYWRFTKQGWGELLKKFEAVSITPYSGKELTPVWYLVTAQK